MSDVPVLFGADGVQSRFSTFAATGRWCFESVVTPKDGTIVIFWIAKKALRIQQPTSITTLANGIGNVMIAH